MDNKTCVGCLTNIRDMFVVGSKQCEGQALKYHQNFIEALNYAIKSINDGERPHAEWIPKQLWDNTHVWVCSECGNQNTHGITVEKACWKCGAKMKGGAE